MRRPGECPVTAKSYLLVTMSIGHPETDERSQVRQAGATELEGPGRKSSVPAAVLVAQRLPELGQPLVRRRGVDGGDEGQVRRAQAGPGVVPGRGQHPVARVGDRPEV